VDASFDTIIGIDLGGGKGKNTAVCVVERRLSHHCGEIPAFLGNVVFSDTRNVEGVPFYDRELSAFIRRYLTKERRTLVAINAPLVLPACIRCELDRCPGVEDCVDFTVVWFRRHDKKGGSNAPEHGRKPGFTPYTQRVCERYLEEKLELVCRECLGQGSGPIAARAQHLVRQMDGVLRLNENLIEVYPKATLHGLYGSDIGRSYKANINIWENRARLLEYMRESLAFSVWREGALRNDHCFDAVVAAFTGLLSCNEHWSIPKAFKEVASSDGWIWSPATMERRSNAPIGIRSKSD